MHNYPKEYKSIIADILENKDFRQIEHIRHHDSNRLTHSVKVSYYAYVIARLMHLDYVDVARAGLLHDFYLDRTVDFSKVKDKVKLFTIGHPNDAIDNSLKYFNLNSREIDIIRSHMFPLDFHVPRYAESWVVNMTDSFISISEFFHKFRYQISYAANLYVLFLFNFLR